jgi:hypothetical protein
LRSTSSPPPSSRPEEFAVAGLDLSLTGPALCVLPAGWAPGDWRAVQHLRVDVPQDLRGVVRVELIVEQLYKTLVERHLVQRVFIEQYAFAFAQNAITNIAELVGAVRYRFWSSAGVAILPLVASSSRKLLFGKQPRMDRKTWKRFIEQQLRVMGAELPDDDTRDAFVVANHGRHSLGLPCLSVGA